MKRLSTYLGITMALAACSVEGVRETETTEEKQAEAEAKTNDTVKPLVIDSAYLIKEEDGKFASEKVDYDTAFSFSQKPVIEKRKTSSGIVLEILTKTEGEKIKKGDVISLIYRGKLSSGKIIESSEAFGKPLPCFVGLGMTFAEFDNILASCRLGERIRCIVPASKAYGKQGHGKLIPPNSDLVYEIHIVGSTRFVDCQNGVKLYPVISKPLARQVTVNDKIMLSYFAWTEKGKLFDATASRQKDAEVDLTQTNTLKGWRYALTNMREGEKAMVYMPSAMGYGSQGIPEMVPPNSNLVYLFEVKKIN